MEDSMTSALNLTLPLKQDAASKAALAHLKSTFATSVQPAIDAALRKSGVVHFARVLVLPGDQYIQVLTEYDGNKRDYTEFFRKELQGVFKAIFSLVEGVPPWDEINNPDSFYLASKGFNVKALGSSTSGDPDEGWLFNVYGGATVKDILTKLG
jgi:hypothetical protein